MSKTGRPPKVTDDELLGLFRAVDRPFITASDVTDEYSLSGQQARRRLKRLRERGEIEREKVGGSAVVWWKES